MCRGSSEPGGPRRCSSDSRAALQQGLGRVADLERTDAQLVSHAEVLLEVADALQEYFPVENVHAAYDVPGLAAEVRSGDEGHGYRVDIDQLKARAVAHERLDLGLTDLPDLMRAPRPRTFAEGAARLDERRLAALEVADVTSGMAQRILDQGDADAAGELAAEASRYLAEAQRIDARRTAPEPRCS